MTIASRKRRPTHDPTVYPSDDFMGEGALQRFISELLRTLVERLLREAHVKAFIGADQFIYYEQFNPKKCVAPDVYVLVGVDPNADVPSWKVWERDGVVPSFAFEIVSSDRLKDYEESPKRYDELGTRELVVFDPEFESGASRVRWQVFRRLKGRGLVCVEATNDDRVRSKVLGCYLRSMGAGPQTRVRLGLGRAGDALFATDAEAADERAQVESLARAQANARLLAESRARTQADERAETESRARAQADERAQAAEREVAKLRAELARLRAKAKSS